MMNVSDKLACTNCLTANVTATTIRSGSVTTTTGSARCVSYFRAGYGASFTSTANTSSPCSPAARISGTTASTASAATTSSTGENSVYVGAGASRKAITISTFICITTSFLACATATAAASATDFTRTAASTTAF